MACGFSVPPLTSHCQFLYLGDFVGNKHFPLLADDAKHESMIMKSSNSV